MNILHIYKDYYPVLGGMENHIRVLAEAQAASSHQVSVLVTSQGRRTEREERNGVQVIKAARMCTLASAPISFPMPVILGRLRPDVAHLHFPYPWGELANLLCGRAKRMVITYHSDVVRQRSLLKLYLPFLWATLRRADRIVATSPRYIESSPFLSRLPEKCSVIPLGVDTRRFSTADAGAVADLRRRYPGPNLLFVGRLRYYKGLQYLIQAMPTIPAALLVVGDGPMRDEWAALARELHVTDRVHFLTDVDDDALPAWYHASDIFILPSCHRSEAFGTVLLEAMAGGLPMISTELGTGTSWVNQHGQTGLVVPSADPRALAEAARGLLEDPDLCQRMGIAARRRAQVEFDQGLMITRVESLYHELLGSS